MRRKVGSLTNSKWRRIQFPLRPVLSSSLAEELEYIIRVADVDQDGKVKYEEFVRLHIEN